MKHIRSKLVGSARCADRTPKRGVPTLWLTLNAGFLRRIHRLRFGARSPPSVSRTAPDGDGHLRRFVESAGARRQHATGHLRGVSIGHDQRHYAANVICQRRLD